MLDSVKIGGFISRKRRELGMTQQHLADRLNISFQAVSKWENGSTFPNVELLPELSKAMEVTVDELLSGCEKDGEELSYSKEWTLPTRIRSKRKWQSTWRQGIKGF